jgi:hypothetical protein
MRAVRQTRGRKDQVRGAWPGRSRKGRWRELAPYTRRHLQGRQAGRVSMKEELMRTARYSMRKEAKRNARASSSAGRSRCPHEEKH